MVRRLILISLVVLVIPVYAKLDLEPRGPLGEPVECTLNRRFSTENALGCLRKTASALTSFDALVEESKTFISKERLIDL